MVRLGETFLLELEEEQSAERTLTCVDETKANEPFVFIRGTVSSLFFFDNSEHGVLFLLEFN